MPDLIVTNFNRNFTGVSATAAGVVRQQARDYNLALVGHALPGCPSPITKAQAITLSRTPPKGRPFTIWHVRRNPEMRTAIWARDVLRLPIRIVFTSAAQRYHSIFPRWLISRMDAIISTTERAAEFVSNSTKTVPHGVDTERIFPIEDRVKAWAETGYSGTMVLATIGRIRTEKGTDRFVESMLRLLPDHPDMTALVIGRAAASDQAFLETLKSKIAAASLSERLLFPGEIAPDALPALMRALSAVVQLPRYEGYGMAPLEGMASGVPFIATDAGYYRSFSGQGQTGVIVPEDDAEATANAISDLLGNPDRHAKMSRDARDAAETHFSIGSESDAINAVYETLWAKG